MHPSEAIQERIKPYGFITGVEENRGRRFSLTAQTNVMRLSIALLCPSGMLTQEGREVRTELYLQAESIMEILKHDHFQLIRPPTIVLSGSDKYLIEGTMEVELEC